MRALEIDSTLGEAHAMLGVYLGVHDFEWEAAERSFRHALELCPASPEVRIRYVCSLLEPHARLDEAISQLELALGFDPLSSVVHRHFGHCLIHRRDFGRATEELRLAVELEPCYWIAHMMLAGALAFQRRFEEALAICEKLVEANGPNPILLGSVAVLRALVGDRQGAEETRVRLMESGHPGPRSNIALGWLHMGLGETERCLDWFEKAVEEREPLICEFKPKPLYDSLRSHPRFQALLRTMQVTP